MIYSYEFIYLFSWKCTDKQQGHSLSLSLPMGRNLNEALLSLSPSLSPSHTHTQTSTHTNKHTHTHTHLPACSRFTHTHAHTHAHTHTHSLACLLSFHTHARTHTHTHTQGAGYFYLETGLKKKNSTLSRSFVLLLHNMNWEFVVTIANENTWAVSDHCAVVAKNGYKPEKNVSSTPIIHQHFHMTTDNVCILVKTAHWTMHAYKNKHIQKETRK